MCKGIKKTKEDEQDLLKISGIMKHIFVSICMCVQWVIIEIMILTDETL